MFYRTDHYGEAAKSSEVTPSHRGHRVTPASVRPQSLAHTPAAPTELHGPSQNVQAPTPDMRRPPRARIALIGEPLLPQLLQCVEARPRKKTCHAVSETGSCTRGRRYACETSTRGCVVQRRAHGHDLVLTSAPLEEKALAREQVEEERAKLSQAACTALWAPANGSRQAS